MDEEFLLDEMLTGLAGARELRGRSYRVQLERGEFLDLVKVAKPKRIYARELKKRNMHFFWFDGFVMYTYECDDHDFKQNIFYTMKISNEPWSE